jgi:hypothetical protein
VAAIMFDAVLSSSQLRRRLGMLLSSCREWLDAFVSNRMRHAAATAGLLRSKPSRRASPSPPIESPAARFDPVDPEVISDTIPAFYIGRNKAGLWVARDAKGRSGGIFLFKRSALRFAHARTASACATIFPSECFELDLMNEGNRLAPTLASFMTGLRRDIRRITKTAALRSGRFNAL